MPPKVLVNYYRSMCVKEVSDGDLTTSIYRLADSNNTCPDDFEIRPNHAFQRTIGQEESTCRNLTDDALVAVDSTKFCKSAQLTDTFRKIMNGLRLNEPVRVEETVKTRISKAD